MSTPEVLGPRETDLLRLLRNVRAREGARGHLTLIDGRLAELMAWRQGRRWVRSFRIAGLCGGDWVSQRTALKWARAEDAKASASVSTQETQS